ncbi:hypothetical protein ANCCAN_02567 [Ancylostoma caninum]|uniref:Uncharacterized protein n=1 Tax=Ancylostoma caninum TaxID=29170 RepID=A0A368H3P2_ANCCA|nr:hypothetical protein ANCCAN_02567 [Ancylostoma caninum]
MDPLKDCENEPFFEQLKKHWSYYDKNGTAMAIAATSWTSKYPDNTCADLPRITAAMYTTGYIDVPAVARRPVVCVTGLAQG